MLSEIRLILKKNVFPNNLKMPSVKVMQKVLIIYI